MKLKTKKKIESIFWVLVLYFFINPAASTLGYLGAIALGFFIAIIKLIDIVILRKKQHSEEHEIITSEGYLFPTQSEKLENLYTVLFVIAWGSLLYIFFGNGFEKFLIILTGCCLLIRGGIAVWIYFKKKRTSAEIGT